MQDIVGHPKGVGERRLLIGDAEQVLVRDDDQRIDDILQFLKPAFGEAHTLRAFEMERLGDHADRKDAVFPGRPCDHRCGARAGAAAHAGSNEHHVAAVQVLDNLIDFLFGGCPADFRPRTGAKALSDAQAQLDLTLTFGLGEGLCVGIRHNAHDALDIRGEHVVDRIAAGAADPENDDSRPQFGRSFGHGKIEGHCGLLGEPFLRAAAGAAGGEGQIVDPRLRVEGKFRCITNVL